jgi:hypothetical protein
MGKNQIFLIACVCVVIFAVIAGVIYYWFNNKKEIKIKEEIIENQACDYKPVCGVDNKTYTNKCRAKIAGVEIAYDGVCNNSNNNCTNIGPVCGVDNKTYENSCDAKVEILHKGECVSIKPPLSVNFLIPRYSANVACSAINRTVCGIDGKEYNKCGLIEFNGPSPIVPCTDECNNLYDYNPVCGKDNKTYVNKCRANATKIDVLYKGFCKENNEKDKDCINIGPVCGVNNVTYQNSCDAPVEILYKGPCVNIN